MLDYGSNTDSLFFIFDAQQWRMSWNKTTKLNCAGRNEWNITNWNCTTHYTNSIVVPIRNHAQRTWEDDENEAEPKSSSTLILYKLKKRKQPMRVLQSHQVVDLGQSSLFTIIYHFGQFCRVSNAPRRWKKNPRIQVIRKTKKEVKEPLVKFITPSPSRSLPVSLYLYLEDCSRIDFNRWYENVISYI